MTFSHPISKPAGQANAGTSPQNPTISHDNLPSTKHLMGIIISAIAKVTQSLKKKSDKNKVSKTPNHEPSQNIENENEGPSPSLRQPLQLGEGESRAQERPPELALNKESRGETDLVGEEGKGKQVGET